MWDFRCFLASQLIWKSSHYWHCPHCMLSRVYETVQCPSVCLSQHGPTAAHPLLHVCCCGRGGQEILRLRTVRRCPLNRTQTCLYSDTSRWTLENDNNSQRVNLVHCLNWISWVSSFGLLMKVKIKSDAEAPVYGISVQNLIGCSIYRVYTTVTYIASVLLRHNVVGNKPVATEAAITSFDKSPRSRSVAAAALQCRQPQIFVLLSQYMHSVATNEVLPNLGVAYEYYLVRVPFLVLSISSCILSIQHTKPHTIGITSMLAVVRRSKPLGTPYYFTIFLW